MVKRNWVDKTILGIIVCNIIILAHVFLIPRTQFMMDHWDWEYEALMETVGAADTPNQYSKTYKLANKIKKITKENSIILMPADNWEFGSNRSIIIQRLYPRKVYFFGDEDFYDRRTNIGSETMVYAVAFSEDGSDLCFKKESRKLGETSFVICRSNSSN